MVFGQQRDMLDVAENFLEFFVEESCGQCTPCRLGNPKLLEGVGLLKQGACSATHLADLKAWARPCRWPPSAASGQTSPERLPVDRRRLRRRRHQPVRSARSEE